MANTGHSVEYDLNINTNNATNNIDKLDKALNKSAESADKAATAEEELNAALNNTGKAAESASTTLDSTSESADKLGKSIEKTSDSAEQLKVNTDNLQKVSAGFQGAIQLAVGSMALFGAESEQVTKIMQKMAAVMVFTDGLKKIGEGVVAMRELRKATNAATAAQNAFNTSLLANPIAAVVTLLAGLAIAIYEVGKAWKEAADRGEEFNLKLQEFDKHQQGYIRTIENRIKVMKAEGATEKEILQERIKMYETLRDEVGKTKSTLEGIKRTRGLSDEEKKALDDAVQKYNELQNKVTDLGIDLQVLEKEEKKAADEASNAANKSGEIKSAIKDVNTEVKDLTDSLKALFDLMDEMIMSSKDDWTDRLVAHYDRLKEIREELSTIEDPFNPDDEAEEIMLQPLEKMQTLLIKNKKEAKEMWDNMSSVEKMDAVNATVSNFGGALNDMFGAFMSNMDESSEEYKALAVTQTVISTLMGMVNAITSAFSPTNAYLTVVGQSVMAAVQSAAVLAAGIASITQIKSANEGSSISGASSIISGSAARVDNAATGVSSYALDSISGMQTSKSVDATGGMSQQKVYVLSSDITMKQSQTSRLKTNVRF